MQAACAFSRSQLKLAVKGWRTLKAQRFSTRLATPGPLAVSGVLMPWPQTISSCEPAVRRR